MNAIINIYFHQQQKYEEHNTFTALSKLNYSNKLILIIITSSYNMSRMWALYNKLISIVFDRNICWNKHYYHNTYIKNT